MGFLGKVLKNVVSGLSKIADIIAPGSALVGVTVTLVTSVTCAR